MHYTRQRGFSLLEILLAVLIIGILASAAYPLYTDYVIKTKRSEAEMGLLQLASAMEQYYTRHNHYQGATLAKLAMPTTTEHGYYRLAIRKLTPTTFELAAIPQGAQQRQDANCGTLTLDHVGRKGVSGPGTIADCWR